MPRNTTRSLGISPSEVFVNAGGEQFFLVNTSNTPPTVTITFGNLPDGTDFIGQTAFTGNPAFSTGATNYIWYRLSTGVLENNDTGFLVDADTIPLWRLVVDGGGAITSTFDSRPWFSGAVGSGLTANSGVVLDGAGTNVFNTNPSAYRMYAANVGFTWDATAGTLTWQAADGGTPDDITLEITDPVSGTVIQSIAVPGSRAGITTTGDYVYFDMDRVSAFVTLSVSSTPPAMIQDRFLFGRRISNPAGGGDVFIFFNNHILANSASSPSAANSQYPPILLPNNEIDGILAASSPSVSNPFLTGPTATVQAALNAASSPSASNPFLTQNQGQNLLVMDHVASLTPLAFGTATIPSSATRLVIACAINGVGTGLYFINVTSGTISGSGTGGVGLGGPPPAVTPPRLLISGGGGPQELRLTIYGGAGGTIEFEADGNFVGPSVMSVAVFVR
jgi:hypothetical protein